MKKYVTANDVFEIERALDTVLEGHLKLPLNLALKLVKIRREVSEITDYVTTRVCELIPKIASPQLAGLTDQERLLYGGIMASQVELENYDITEEDFSGAHEMLVELGTAEKIALLF